MHIQHDPDARSPAPRPSLLVAGVSRASRGEAAAPPRFLDSVDGARAPTAGPALRWACKPAWLAGGVALLAGVGMVLGIGQGASAWLEQEAPATADAPPRPAATAVDIAVPARGPARIERLETVPRPVALAASTPAPGAAQDRPGSPAAMAAAAAHGRARPPMPRRQEAAAAADAAMPAEALADPQALESVQADADAELLQAVMAWDQRHPPTPERAAVPAARASSSP
ncbi:hypothetical protein [uncultured Azohydromonas sp.]|jgi:hypothetical protein|uniref:hypothetical protein n=1 Tax=uncultured Azohydromonas sp. TaxID=487342 RepID=UPI00261389CD|nr:hypothetical protein [uncultured Azohydromonas sp.]